MLFAANVVLGLIMLLHVWIVVLEMVLWTKPLGRKTFGMTVEMAEATKVLAANQGLYNGFLVAGLLWGLYSGVWDVKLFFAACVFVAGVYGGLTAKRSILFVQGLLSLLAILLLCAAH